MSITIAGIEFANHLYDERGDVLYVDVKGCDGGARAHSRWRPDHRGGRMNEVETASRCAARGADEQSQRGAGAGSPVASAAGFKPLG